MASISLSPTLPRHGEANSPRETVRNFMYWRFLSPAFFVGSLFSHPHLRLLLCINCSWGWWHTNRQHTQRQRHTHTQKKTVGFCCKESNARHATFSRGIFSAWSRPSVSLCRVAIPATPAPPRPPSPRPPANMCRSRSPEVAVDKLLIVCDQRGTSNKKTRPSACGDFSLVRAHNLAHNLL